MFLCYYILMGKSKASVFKVIMTVIFALLVFASFFYVIFGNFDENSNLKLQYFAYACVGLCFLFSLCFIKINLKKILLTLGLAFVVIADYFLILMPSEQNKLVGVCVFCVFQFVLLLYTLFLNQSIGIRIVNIAIRLTLCLLAYFLIPNYFEVGTLELVSIMYILNFLVSLIFLLIHVKSEWLLFLGCLLFFLCDIVVGLKNGGIALLNLSGPFVDFLNSGDISFYLYIPGLFLIATSSVYAKKKN